MSLKISGSTVEGDSWTVPDRRTKWEVFVDVIDRDLDRARLESYLVGTLEVDLKDPHLRAHEVYTDRNYAMAVMQDFFSEKFFCRFERSDIGYGQPPEREPDKTTPAFKLWAVKGETTEELSPRHAGFDLYVHCGVGKMEIAEARQFIREKHPTLLNRWDQILKEFRGNGGKSTDKYLRRES